ncbi:antibiotic biosynthesis monooxygenase [Bradyrhizobium sp. dw_411]|uniref:putative quinol monooxygenase n=1 Tax=Bradyrhizobium sp. dw_411 TaxID=2720082 RepID=UPI001BCBA9DE|nr:antibiotic biosynthesis monooxygenase [Bradyrhizobium sp. dw_411]
MHRYLVAAVMIMAGLLAHGSAARAQDAAQPVYIVTYVEIAPGSTADARKLILGYVTEAKKAPGATQIEALQRISDPSHFGLIELWKSPADKQAFAATDTATKYRAALLPLQSAPYDERIHNAFSVGATAPLSGNPIVLMTHVDIIPTQVEPGTAKVKAFVEAGRSAPGNRRFDDLIQANRKNHFTVVEAWNAPSDKSKFVASPVSRTFRTELQPMSGGLYDERAYRLLR